MTATLERSAPATSWRDRLQPLTYAGGGWSVTLLVTVIAGLLTFILAWRLTAGVAVYWVASNAVGLGQAILLRRRPAL